jgi:RimJ/RimL family protein N-acetyltransferase
MAPKEQILVTESSLVGDKLFLRPASAEDVAGTYHWFLLSDPMLLAFDNIPFHSASEAAEQYKRQEKSTVWQQFVAVRKTDRLPVATISFMNLNMLNRTADLELIVDPDERRHGFGSEALRLLENHLFDYRGIYKLSFQVSSLNKAGVKFIEKCGFQRDGTLRRHHFYEREYYDVYLYSRLSSD